LADVVAATLGIQAQMPSAAELDLAIRARATVSDVRRALWTERTIVRMAGPRDTIHFLPSGELATWQAALRSRTAGAPGGWTHPYDLTERQAAELFPAIRAALGAEPVAKTELAAAVSARVGRWAHDRLAGTWADLVTPAAYAGLLAYGPPAGTRTTFVGVDAWLRRRTRPRNEDRALETIWRRYLATYGPATPDDFARWFGLEPARSAALFEQHRDELVAIDVDGWLAWLPAADSELPERSSTRSVQLVPQYDAYVVGRTRPELVVIEPARGRVFGHGRGVFEGAVGVPVVLEDGIVVGIWERNARRGRVGIRIELPERERDRPLRRAAGEAADRIGEALELPVDVSFGRLS
jgi:hypothetical protein